MTLDPKNLSATAVATFADEFDAFRLWDGQAGWDVTGGPQWSGRVSAAGTLPYNNELQWYVDPGRAPTSGAPALPNPFSVTDGHLDITARQADVALRPQIAGQQYTSGIVTTFHDFSQTYGYFEMRAQLPAGQGIWPAFWLLPTDGSWPPELDVMEMLGHQTTTLHTTVHSKFHGTRKYDATHYDTTSSTLVPDMSAGFHAYGVNWQPDQITWYFDGQEIFRAATPADMHKPMYMVANLAVGGDWPGSPNGSTSFPATMKIDYIRAYAKTENVVGAKDSTLLGTSAANTLLGGADNDSIYGLGGNDFLNGGAGWNMLFGGSGSDTATFALPRSSYVVSQTGSLVTVKALSGTGETNYVSGVETLAFADSSVRATGFVGDFNGDGRSDMPLQNQNQPAVWFLNGRSLVGGGNTTSLGEGWNTAGAADFNADGKADFLLQNQQQLAVWNMDGTSLVGGGNIGTLAPGWMVAGTGDFDGDGKGDILLQNGPQLAIWELTGTTVSQGGVFGTLGAGWAVAGVDDFNGDGQADILLQNEQLLAVWEMSNGQLAGGGNIGLLAAGWSVAGTGDFNHDDHADILLQNGQTLAVWEMDGPTLTGGGVFGTLGDGWAVAGAGDFSGDGTADVLLRNGQLHAVWEMTDSHLSGGGNVGFLGAGWDFV